MFNTHTRLAVTLALLSGVLTLTACGGGGSDTTGATDKTLPEKNTLPVINGLPSAAVKSGTPYQFKPEYEDADGDPLTFKITNKPDWATFDGSNGTLSGQPSKADIDVYADIVISVSDGKDDTSLEPFSIKVLVKNINRDHIEINGAVTSVLPGTPGADSAINVKGTAAFNVNGNTQTLEDAIVVMEFDDQGNLLNMSGETTLPKKMSDGLAINSSVKARIGMFKGVDINADPDLGIMLKDDIDYFVYYIGTKTDITVGSENTTQIKLEPPLSGEIVFISDPTDPFYYYYANIPLVGELGRGESENGFIPFKPTENLSNLDAFDGHTLDKGSISLGIKAVDLLSFEGTRVIKQPVLGEINWDDVMDSNLTFKAGLNGKAKFALSVLSVGLFEFDLASASATLDMGLKRQNFALQGTVAPNVSWQPDWFAILPEGVMVSNLVVNGKTGFKATITGEFKSTIPVAAFKGAMVISQKGAKFTAQIPDQQIPIDFSAEFKNGQTSVEITAPIETNAISQSINQQLDEELAQIEQAVTKLTDAISDYEFEVSLRGVRKTIPALVDQTVPKLKDLPTQVYNTVYSSVKTGIESKCYSKTVTVLGVSKKFTFCAKDYVNEVQIAKDSAADAKIKTNTEVNAIIPALQELKKQALAADDASLRQALKTALLLVYSKRTVTVSINRTVTIPLPWPINDRSYNIKRTERLTVLDTITANKLKFAADNVHRIQETSDIKISAQQIVDQLPTKEIINKAKQEVNNGLNKIPSFQGAGYVINQGNYLSYIILNNEKISVNANVLNPFELMQAITDEVNRRVKAGEFQ